MRLAALLLSAVALPLTVSPAGADDPAAVVGAHCRASPDIAKLCDCLLRQLAKLGEDQQALVAALLTDDAAAAGALRSVLAPDDAAAAETFMARETLLCRPSG